MKSLHLSLNPFDLKTLVHETLSPINAMNQEFSFPCEFNQTKCVCMALRDI